MHQPKVGATLVSVVVWVVLLAGCGGNSESPSNQVTMVGAQTTVIPSRTSAVSSTPQATPTPMIWATVNVPEQVHSALLQDADLGPGWKRYPGDSPGKQLSTNPFCERAERVMYEPASGVLLAKAGWLFDGGAQEDNLTQVIRGYSTSAAAAAFITGIKTALGKCTTWKEGGLDGKGFTTSTSTVTVTPLGDQHYAWVISAEAMGVKAGGWQVAARTGRVVSIVSFTPGTGMDGQRFATDIAHKRWPAIHPESTEPPLHRQMPRRVS